MNLSCHPNFSLLLAYGAHIVICDAEYPWLLYVTKICNQTNPLMPQACIERCYYGSYRDEWFRQIGSFCWVLLRKVVGKTLVRGRLCHLSECGCF